MEAVQYLPSLNLAITLPLLYLTLGAIVCFAHPLLLREVFAELKTLDLGATGVFLKPLLASLVSLLYCALWPIAWFNVGKSEKKAQATLDAQLERLRAFHQLTSAMNASVTYAGGDGTSIEQAVILQGTTLLSGPRAERDFIAQHYPGYELRRQLLKEEDGRSYDVLEFTTAEAENKTIYFDISDSFRRG